MEDSNQPPENNAENPRLAVAGAIEYNTRDVTQPRPPRNMQDMLRYATEAATSNAGGAVTTSQNMAPMDDQSRSFLAAALESMTTDVLAQLKNGIETIENILESGDCPEEECDAAFDDLLELVDKIDFANDFHRIGGFRIFNPCLTSPSSLMRWRCCELIAELCQNNPYCQEQCLKEGYLSKLLHLVNADSNEIVCVKALYAVSCLVRENLDGFQEFTKLDGFSSLLRALQTDCEKLKIKASFLFSSLCSLSPQFKDDIVGMGFVEQLVGLIIQNKSEFNIVEHLLSALLTLITENLAAEEIAKKPDLQLKSILAFIIDNAKELDEAKEVVEYARAIEATIFIEKEGSVEEDR